MESSTTLILADVDELFPLHTQSFEYVQLRRYVCMLCFSSYLALLSLIRSYDELRKYRKIRAVSGARDDNKEKVSYFSGIAQTLRQCELVRKSN